MKKSGFLKRMFSFEKKQPEQEAEDFDQGSQQEDALAEKLSPVLADAEEQTDLEYQPDIKENEPIPENLSADLENETELIDSLPKQTDQICESEPMQSKFSEIAEGDTEEASDERDGDFDPPELSPTDAQSESDSAPSANRFEPHNVTKRNEEFAEVAVGGEPEKKSWFKRLSQGLSRSSSQLTENIAVVFTKKKLDEEALEHLENILLQADLGMDTALNIVDSLAKQRMGKDVGDEEVRAIMAEEIEKVLVPVAKPLELDLEHKPHVILVVGVNGSGKTTTIGKLSQKLNDGGYSTMLAAGDTFRAAAIEQLNIWGERTGSPVVSKPPGSDSSGLAFDAWQRAKGQGSDVLMVDTAGRLQNRSELMAELEKIIRVLKKKDPTAPHTVLLTLDATTGQNALNQVEIFGKVAGVNGLIMTKLDGSARGGILVAISTKFQLPVYFLGVGEQVEDLEPFEARDFARSIAGLNI